MALEVTVAGILAFSVTLALLMVYSYMDIQDRRVPNRVMSAGLVIGLLSGLVLWHVIDQLFLHITAAIFVSLIVGLFFRIGAIGGADAKAALTISIVSPGIEFVMYGTALFEAIIGGGVQLLVMLLLGYLYQLWEQDNPERKPAPLIPFLLVGYLLVQLLALV